MLGFSSISEQPIATEDFSGNVTIGVTANQLTLSIGSSTILSGALVQPTGEGLTVGFGALTITADATFKDKYPVANCSKICKLVLVIDPQRPAFSPVAINSSFEFVE